MSDVGTGIAATAGAILLVAGLVYGGTEFGWWFQAKDAQVTGQVTRGSVNFQQGHEDELSNQIVDLQKITGQIAAADADQAPLLKAQRLAEANAACRVARDITDPDPDEATWRDQNCFAGAVKPESTYNQ